MLLVTPPQMKMAQPRLQLLEETGYQATEEEEAGEEGAATATETMLEMTTRLLQQSQGLLQVPQTKQMLQIKALRVCHQTVEVAGTSLAFSKV